MAKEGQLRVWWIQNPPSEPEYHEVASIEEAIRVLDKLERSDLENEAVWCNAGGLEVFEDNQWSEFYDSHGQDIDKIKAETGA